MKIMYRFKRTYIVALLSVAALTATAGFVLSPSQTVLAAAPTAGSLEGLFLKAEAEPNRETRIGLWRELLARADVAGDKTGSTTITAARIKAAVIEDYLQLYKKEKDVDHLKKAQDFINGIYAQPADKIWAYTYLLAQVSQAEEFNGAARKFALIMLDEAQIALKSVQDAAVKEEINYALAMALTYSVDNKPVFTGNEMEMVHQVALEMTNPNHRSQVMRRLALSGQYPATYAPVYELLKENDAQTKDLLAVHEKALADDQFDLALTSILVIKEKKDRADALITFFDKTLGQGDISRARRIAEKIDNPAKGADAWSSLGGHYLIHGYSKESTQAYERAETAATNASSDESRDKARKLISDRKKRDQAKAEKKSEQHSESDTKFAESALKALSEEGIQAAVAIVRQMQDPVYRAKTFRKIAEIQTKQNDSYGVLNEKNADFYNVKGQGDIPDPAKLATIQEFEKSIADKTGTDPKGLFVQSGIESPVGQRISVDPLVERLKANGDTVRAAVPLPGQAHIVRSYYENNLFNSKFYEVAGNAQFTAQQKSAAPEAIIIESGTIDLPGLYDFLRDSGHAEDMTRTGKTYLLRRPLVVGPRAELVVTGDDVEALRLSTESGAYIVVVGTLYFSDSKLIGWNEAKGEPMWAEYKDKRSFRPFVTGWSQSEMFIGNSELVALGYGNGKSYGLSYSAGPNIWFKYGNDPHSQRPTATIVDSSFNNTLYGFYSYEADDVIISGNEYVDNIVYGVDPHDRSLRLAIGYNTAYNTHKKHGIIISREVSDSLIFGNVTFENKGTGIMLDRDSNGTFVYGNTSFANHQDGLTLFESDCEVVAANYIFANNGSGFRIRNSYNIGLFYNNIAHNKANGISAYEGTLLGDPAHKFRDFALDPYDELTSVTAVGNTMQANGVGMNVDTVDGLFMKKNKFIDQSPKVVHGAVFRDNPELLFRYDEKGRGVSVAATCPTLAETLYVQSCKYRTNGTLSGDGMDQLTDRIKTSTCAKSTTDVKKVYIEEDENEE